MSFNTATAVEFSPNTLARKVGVLPHVVKIFYAREHPNTVHVWTVVKSFAREIRDRVYDAERIVCKSFPDYEFDFSVIEGDESTTIFQAELAYPAK